MGKKSVTVKDFSLLMIVPILLIYGISFLLFGEITMRRLRKNPAVKDSLGASFISGYDIINVSMALSLPKRFMRWAKGSRFPGLYADVDILYQHTSRLDRALARLHQIILWLSVIYVLTVSYLYT